MSEPAPLFPRTLSIASGSVTVDRFREASDSVSELTALLHQAYAPLGEMGLRFVATWQDDSITLKRARSGECYLARVEGRMVGTILFRSAAQTTGCPWYDRPDVASFGQFGLLPEVQGIGLGGALLNLCEERARATAAAYLACDTAEPAAHLTRYYAARGYRQVETVQWGSTNYRSVILSKALLDANS